ncbi:hypothetical protein NEF87_004632 [Candidatus Lokiarchaeum ossiferum]|uniref:ParB/Sulfiredoxin domain-containing protein n=1 Tax=Candidatus Lokiarchaeum ossiferum TaxID=2951803 RepID=A0ABY6HXU9_9ARCH|nr:hypothetical protein NEF87_004632 [Candidatus Lokiarchaeum sp. B-35]
MKSYEIDWQHIEVEQFSREHLKHFTTVDIKKMFLREKVPMVPELAYLSFLMHSAWGVNFDIQRGVDRTLLQLRLPLFEGKGLSWKERRLNPEKIWASEDSLDFDKVEMVTAAIKYMLKTNKPIPPVVVWLIKTESKYNLVQHDGHHRTYVCNKLGIRVPAVVLEYWIDNRENPLLHKRLHYREIDTYVTEMPIVKRQFSEARK